jgi:hypothetical protein
MIKDIYQKNKNFFYIQDEKNSVNPVNFLLLNEDAFQLDHLLLYVDIEMYVPRFEKNLKI